MKLALRKRGKVLLTTGLACLVVSGASLWVTLGGPADYRRIKVGMTIPEVVEIHGFQDLYSRHIIVEHEGHWECHGELGYKTQATFLFPPQDVGLVFQDDRLTHKYIQRPSLFELWTHWMNQLGL